MQRLYWCVSPEWIVPGPFLLTRESWFLVSINSITDSRLLPLARNVAARKRTQKHYCSAAAAVTAGDKRPVSAGSPRHSTVCGCLHWPLQFERVTNLVPLAGWSGPVVVTCLRARLWLAHRISVEGWEQLTVKTLHNYSFVWKDGVVIFSFFFLLLWLLWLFANFKV